MFFSEPELHYKVMKNMTSYALNEIFRDVKSVDRVKRNRSQSIQFINYVLIYVFMHSLT